MKKTVLSVIMLSAILSSGCGSSPLVRYSFSGDASAIPHSLTITSNLKNESKDFLDLYAKATDICNEVSPRTRPRVVVANGSCDKGQCYYNLAFRCEE